MEIKKSYLQKYIRDIAVDQLTEDYVKKGYAVFKEELINGYIADIVARKNDETIIIEVKDGPLTEAKKAVIASLGNYANQHPNHKFLVVIATPPKEKKMGIDHIDDLLRNYLISNLPDELDELSAHTIIHDIADVEIDEMTINEQDIFVKGSGIVEVELSTNSDMDKKMFGYKEPDNFPFEFELTLEYNKNNELQIIAAQKLKVDTTSYFV